MDKRTHDIFRVLLVVAICAIVAVFFAGFAVAQTQPESSGATIEKTPADHEDAQAVMQKPDRAREIRRMNYMRGRLAPPTESTTEQATEQTVKSSAGENVFEKENSCVVNRHTRNLPFVKQ